MAEVINIAEAANRVSSDIFEWFKWEKIPYMDENFTCLKVEKHKASRKNTRSKKVPPYHTHPVDVVFEYFDPYLNRRILLNTDLKSYSSKSINSGRAQEALESLAKTIDCAKGSQEWRGKYNLYDKPFEVRGMLFIYNHDDKYNGKFMDVLNAVSAKKLPIAEGQILHIVHPDVIRYLTTLVADLKHLISTYEFSKEDYSFYYPDLYLHKHHGDYNNYAATVELLCSPYMIVKHGPIKGIENGEIVDKNGAGYIIYYNQAGTTDHEFMYLFDSLSRFQLLSGEKTIKIRVAHWNPSPAIKNNYFRAKERYVSEWGDDSYKRADLDRIEFEVINTVVAQFRPGVLAWKSQ